LKRSWIVKNCWECYFIAPSQPFSADRSIIFTKERDLEINRKHKFVVPDGQASKCFVTGMVLYVQSILCFIAAPKDQ